MQIKRKTHVNSGLIWLLLGDSFKSLENCFEILDAINVKNMATEYGCQSSNWVPDMDFDVYIRHYSYRRHMQIEYTFGTMFVCSFT